MTFGMNCCTAHWILAAVALALCALFAYGLLTYTLPMEGSGV